MVRLELESWYKGTRILTFSVLRSRIDFISPENLGCGFSVESIMNLDLENSLIFSKSPLAAKSFSFNSSLPVMWIWSGVPSIMGLAVEARASPLRVK